MCNVKAFSTEHVCLKFIFKTAGYSVFVDFVGTHFAVRYGVCAIPLRPANSAG